MDYIEEAMNEREFYNQLNPSPIPAHQHTGADSHPISQANVVPIIPIKVTDATVAPTDTPLLGTTRIYWDATPRYRLWAYVNNSWHVATLT